jgi:hypothetical protein
MDPRRPAHVGQAWRPGALSCSAPGVGSDGDQLNGGSGMVSSTLRSAMCLTNGPQHRLAARLSSNVASPERQFDGSPHARCGASQHLGRRRARQSVAIEKRPALLDVGPLTRRSAAGLLHAAPCSIVRIAHGGSAPAASSS